MIVLIVGDFAVGKDTVADYFVELMDKNDFCVEKIKSYTTREPRFTGEDTHIFCSKEEFLSFKDLVAETKIDEQYYGTRASQFNENKINFYCVDDKGVKDIESSGIDDTFIVEVVRPKWLINASDERLNRKRHYGKYKYNADYRIINDGDLDKLKKSVFECFTFMKNFL